MKDPITQEKLEIEYWKNDPREKPESNSLENVIFKMAEARVFLEKLAFYHTTFANANRILELGAGQGWAAGIVKREFPQTHVVASDISPHAIASVHKWEQIFQIKLDGAVACKSYVLPFDDQSFDLIFCFESAHHFTSLLETLKEVKRVLRPGGVCLFLHEPTCRKWLYPLALWRVRRKRPVVPEDVLVYKDVLCMGETVGLKSSLRFDPTLTNRGLWATLYYMFLRYVPVLKYILPCSGDFMFLKDDQIATSLDRLTPRNDI